MGDIEIRWAKTQDIPRINSLTKEMHLYLGRMVGIRLSKKDLDDEEVNLSELKGILVAENLKSGEVIGYISFSPKPCYDEWYGKHIYLYELTVTRSFRGKGIGEQLMGRFVSLCDKRGLNIKADTFIKNKRTVAFNKKFGFKPFMVYFKRSCER